MECCWHIYDANLGFIFKYFFSIITQKLHGLVSLSNLLPFSLPRSPPAVKCIQLPLSEQYFLPFYTVPALKRAQQSHGESAANRCSAVWKTPGLHGIIYCFHILCSMVTATVNKQNNHKGDWGSCISARPKAAASGAVMCARAELWREAVFERASSSVCTREWEKDPDVKLETVGGGGWGVEGLGWMWLERADVPVSNGWHSHTCPHAHVDTSILAHRSSRTKRFAQLSGAQTA